MAKRTFPRTACLCCGTVFTPTRSWHAFCSSTCRSSSHQAAKTAEWTCTYCGLIGETTDHVPPQSARPTLIALGLAPRYPFVEVRCCHECNCALGRRPLWTVAQRKAYIKGYLKRRYRKYLAIPDWTDDDLKELSLDLQDFTRHGLAVRALTRHRLAH